MRVNLLTVLLLFVLAHFSYANFPRDRQNAWQDDYTALSEIENYKQWGTYNVHDPAILFHDSVYYMYSTDAIFWQRRPGTERPQVKTGNIQVRTSRDLVHWNFEGWAFDSIPFVAKDWVRTHNDNRGATNIWAPFPVKYKDKFRLYYCVSAFGKQISYLGLAESDSPMGPWKEIGPVVRTQIGDKMNAIDPSVVTDPATGEMWMIYGSYFGGLYEVQLNPETGMTLRSDDQGKCVARRANGKKDNIEAPEVVYSPQQKKYYLFVSYDPLMTTYNLRVGRSDKIEGPFYDYFGQDLSDTTNNYPILTYPYQFEMHTGWAGTGHCGVIHAPDGALYLAHQSRLSPENQLMDLHVRKIFWTPDGWPVLSPERYMGEENEEFQTENLQGVWEVIRIQDKPLERGLEFGQILWGEGTLRNMEVNHSFKMELMDKGKIQIKNKNYPDMDKEKMDDQMSKAGLQEKESVAKNRNVRPGSSERSHTGRGPGLGSGSLKRDGEGDPGKQRYQKSKWSFNPDNGLQLILGDIQLKNLWVFVGQDWENRKKTLLFTGLDEKGCSIWGKKVE